MRTPDFVNGGAPIDKKTITNDPLKVTNRQNRPKKVQSAKRSLSSAKKGVFEADSRKRAVGYIRVSSEQQASDGVSLAAQKQKIEAFAALYEYELVAIVEDAGASAKTLERPGLQAALQMLHQGQASILIVAKLDRLTRSVADLAVLIENEFAHYSLVSVSEQIDTGTAAGRLVLNVLMSVAQWEREAIGERTKVAMQHKKHCGELVGAVPYGMRLQEDGKTLLPCEIERPLVELALEQQAQGHSLRLIAQHLESAGHRPRGGGRFHPQTVANILSQNNHKGSALTLRVRQGNRSDE